MEGFITAPPETTFENLIPWNEHPDDAIRYFSGDGIYRKALEVKKKKGRRVWLDLGEVEVIATVSVNGKEVGTLWKPPFLMDITDALQKGKNELEIRVSNLWVNRLIGDEQFPACLPGRVLPFCHPRPRNCTSPCLHSQCILHHG